MSRTGFFIFNTRVNFNLTHNRPADHFLRVFFFLLNSHLSAGPEPSWFTYALSLHYSTLPCSVRLRWDSSLEEDSFVRLPLTKVFAFVPLKVPLGRKLVWPVLVKGLRWPEDHEKELLYCPSEKIGVCLGMVCLIWRLISQSRDHRNLIVV